MRELFFSACVCVEWIKCEEYGCYDTAVVDGDPRLGGDRLVG